MKTKKPLRPPAQPAAVSTQNSTAFASWWQQPPLLALAYGAFFFIFSYFTFPGRPGVVYPLGWYETTYDQGQYYNMAMAMHHGSLGAFQYPVVYPFFGFLGSLVYPKDPFFIPNLLFFSLFVYLSARFFTILFTKKFTVLVASAVLIHATCGMFVFPWTSTLTAPAMLVILLVYLEKRTSALWGVLCGLCVGLMFGTRVADAAFGAAVLGLLALECIRTRTGFRFLAGVALPAGIVTALVLFVNHKFSGLWMGNYYLSIMNQSWCFSCIPWHIYGYVLDPSRFAGGVNPMDIPMVQVLPLLLLAPLGLIFLFVDIKHRRTALGFLAILLAWVCLYAPFVAAVGPTLKYGSMHYAKILFPVLTACSFWALRAIIQPDAQQIRIAAWYSGITAVCLLAILTWLPSKIDLPNIAVSASSNREFDIDFGKPVILTRLVLAGDTPAGLGIELSTDGKTWRRVETREGDEDPRAGGYYMSPARVRQVRLTARPNVNWSFREISAYGWNSPW